MQLFLTPVPKPVKFYNFSIPGLLTTEIEIQCKGKA